MSATRKLVLARVVLRRVCVGASEGRRVVEIKPYLHLLLVQRHALHDVETRCFVGFGVRIICRLEDDLVFGTEWWGNANN